jgi:hypothetical protein
VADFAESLLSTSAGPVTLSTSQTVLIQLAGELGSVDVDTFIIANACYSTDGGATWVRTGMLGKQRTFLSVTANVANNMSFGFSVSLQPPVAGSYLFNCCFDGDPGFTPSGTSQCGGTITVLD